MQAHVIGIVSERQRMPWMTALRQALAKGMQLAIRAFRFEDRHDLPDPVSELFAQRPRPLPPQAQTTMSACPTALRM